MDHQEDARLIESFRNAANYIIKGMEPVSPFQAADRDAAAFKKHAVMK
jgi:hypothetical protein